MYVFIEAELEDFFYSNIINIDFEDQRLKDSGNLEGS